MNRLKELRKALSLKQGEFAQRISTTQGHISDIENGRKELSDRTIKLICLEFGVNEDWLRTGEGEMYNEQDTNLSKLLTTISASKNPQLKEVIIKLAKVDATYVNSINTLLDGLLNESN